MKLKTFLFFLILQILVFFVAKHADAEEIKLKTGEHGCRGFFMFGARIIDLENLSSALERKGYGKFSDKFISLGGGGCGIIGKLIVGGEGHGIIEKSVYNGDFKTSIRGGYGLFDIGYQIYSKNYMNIYPMIGIGGGGINLRIVERKDQSFDEIIENPRRGSELATDGFLLNFSFTIDNLMKIKEGRRCECGLAYGIRIGYLLAPFKTDWKIYGMEVNNGPRASFQGPYVVILIGGGGSCKGLNRF